MYDWMNVKVKKGDKIIIGLGDSFTQGTGAYTEETWAKHNYSIPVGAYSDKELLREHYEGSWVNQLCVNHMPDWKPINLGHSGTGNRSAVKELYLNPEIELGNASQAIVIYFLSGMERFDFINKKYNRAHHFEAMWPNHWDKNSPKPNLWKAYAEDVYSEQFMAMELMLNLLEAQMICKANGWHLIVANAFDQRSNEKWLKKQFAGPMLILPDAHVGKTIDSFDWSTMYHPDKMLTLIEYLLELEGNSDLRHGSWYKHYTELPKPSKYITNCAHPTRLGHSVIAKLFYEHIVKRKLNTI